MMMPANVTVSSDYPVPEKMNAWVLGKLWLIELSCLKMEKMMRYTIYVSQAAKAFSESDLSTLLERSREWNSAHGISKR